MQTLAAKQYFAQAISNLDFRIHAYDSESGAEAVDENTTEAVATLGGTVRGEASGLGGITVTDGVIDADDTPISPANGLFDQILLSVGNGEGDYFVVGFWDVGPYTATGTINVVWPTIGIIILGDCP